MRMLTERWLIKIKLVKIGCYEEKRAEEIAEKNWVMKENERQMG